MDVPFNPLCASQRDTRLPRLLNLDPADAAVSDIPDVDEQMVFGINLWLERSEPSTILPVNVASSRNSTPLAVSSVWIQRLC